MDEAEEPGRRIESERKLLEAVPFPPFLPALFYGIFLWLCGQVLGIRACGIRQFRGILASGTW